MPSLLIRHGLFIRHGLIIPDAELDENFIQSSGPGGQNVNKVASAVQLKFDVGRSPSLPQAVRMAILALSDAALKKRLDAWRAKQTKSVAKKPK